MTTLFCGKSHVLVTENRPRVKVVETKRPHWEELSVVIFWGLNQNFKCFLTVTGHSDSPHRLWLVELLLQNGR